MNFLPTEYIYPLHEPISLSIKLKLYLDNPRTDEEISLVEEYIREAYKNDSAFRFSEESLYEELQQSLVFLGQESKYVANFAMLHSQRDFYGLLARMWIVARYDDEGTHAELKTATIELREKGDVGFFLLEDDHPIISNSRKLTEFCHLISLLIHTQLDEYYGRSLHP
jgi:DNA-binding helix-hairpin-helix protein with protein kinase domain